MFYQTTVSLNEGQGYSIWDKSIDSNDVLFVAMPSVMVSTSAFLACHQC